MEFKEAKYSLVPALTTDWTKDLWSSYRLRGHSQYNATLDDWEERVVVAIRQRQPGNYSLVAVDQWPWEPPSGWPPARPSKIDAALHDTDIAFKSELSRAGLSVDVVDLLRLWIDVKVEAQVEKSALEAARLAAAELPLSPSVSAAPPPDSLQLLSASELAQKLSISDERVRQREKGGDFFSILPPGRQRGRVYLAFQAHPTITGAPLQSVLKVLRDGGTADSGIHAFFTGINPDLAGLTPVEVLLDVQLVPRESNEGASELLALSSQERLELVTQAASYFASAT